MKFILALCFLIPFAFAHEKGAKTRADLLATGEFKTRLNHPWPFPLLSIGHSMHSFQDYGIGGAYWHDGLDIRSAIDQPIYAAAGGKVVNVENYRKGNALYWEIAILDLDGFVWKYHHVDRKTIPENVLEAFKVKGEIPSGTYLGNVVRWPVTTFGEVYHHLHLLVVAKDGKYTNPFLLMEPLPDTVAPVIKEIGLSKLHKPISGNTVKGEHGLFVEASDLTLHDKFILPPYKISYRLDKEEPVLVWEFTNLPSGTSDTDFINDFYLKGTCGDYGCRKFYFNLNFTTSKPRGLMTLPKGLHEVEVTVEDVVGNKTTSSFSWTVL